MANRQTKSRDAKNDFEKKDFSKKDSFDEKERSAKGRNGKDKFAGKGKAPYKDKRGFNDSSWYIPTDQTAKDIGSFSFNRPIGQLVTGSINGNYSEIGHTTRSQVPGVAVIRLAHSLGCPDSETSAINVAAKDVYSFVRHANSGHTNYEAPDMVVYLCAAAEAYSMYSWLTRLYGCFNVFNSRNRYMPKQLIESMFVDYDDVILHINDLRTYINICALKLSSLYIPATMPYFTRRYFTYANVYADSSDPKAQLYLFNPAYFWQYNNTSESGSSLEPVFLDIETPVYLGQEFDNKLTFERIVGIMEALLNNMIGDEDIGIMSGDILKAYGESNLLKVSQISEDYTVLPIYNEEVLGQIHNLRTAKQFTSLDSCRVKQVDATYLAERKEISVGNFVDTGIIEEKFTHDLYLNMHKSDVTPDDVLVATRLQWSSNAVGRDRKSVV